MIAAPEQAETGETRRRPGFGWGVWLAGIAAAVVVFVGWQFGVPVYRQHRLIAGLRARGIHVQTHGRGDPRREVLDWILQQTEWSSEAVFESRVGLDTRGQDFSDADLVQLAAQTRLEWLVLSHSQITDGGLRALERESDLIRVDLTRTRVTPAGVARLKQSLPRCEVLGP